MPSTCQKLKQYKDEIAKWLECKEEGPPEFVNSNAISLFMFCRQFFEYSFFMTALELLSCAVMLVGYYLMDFGQPFKVIYDELLASDVPLGEILWVIFSLAVIGEGLFLALAPDLGHGKALREALTFCRNRLWPPQPTPVALVEIDTDDAICEIYSRNKQHCISVAFSSRCC